MDPALHPKRTPQNPPQSRGLVSLSYSFSTKNACRRSRRLSLPPRFSPSPPGWKTLPPRRTHGPRSTRPSLQTNSSRTKSTRSRHSRSPNPLPLLSIPTHRSDYLLPQIRTGCGRNISHSRFLPRSSLFGSLLLPTRST